MTTTLTPPPSGTDVPPPAGGSPAGPPTRGSSRVVAILVIAFGCLVILGAVLSAIFGTIAAASVQTTSRTTAVTGVSNLDVDVAAGSLRIEFADVDEAELDVTGTWGADRWTLRSEGESLVVASPDGWFADGWFFGGWPFGDNGVGDAVLRLPESLEGSDADLSLAAGELVIADGTYGDFSLDMGAGRARIEASVDDVTAQIAAGSAELTLDGVGQAEFTVSAGSLDATLMGAQPDSVDVQVSAGSLNLTVPEGDYFVSSDVSAGDFDNRIGSTPGADSTVTVQVSAGKATLSAE